ncbi:MAG TPA: signal peptidase II [Gammaproteobacteria bacterium]|jgi:signal peptidase II|nr:signal peptidase II [Acidiferrobacteraceae bacterium]MDP6552454.1 signal peptidase II [Arenicellales bacterium]MDP6792089.1 signal peptidase II [Arenicellales bacterium]MDP6918268.1 signal peptidase II [Arenicellales bacterium]HCX86521.1 signal peptidase II [Gammaproteobacteria bacterium]|tara:strand:+ start:7416 stop:7910 length:495 start_codon:yes stop_codon:yes gene_type:complete
MLQTRTNRRALFALISVLLIVLDWGSKVWLQALLASTGPLEAFPGLRFIIVYNQGAAFGLLASAGGWQRGLLISLAAGVMVYLGWRLWAARPDESRLNLGFAMILGGAAGNLIDRAHYGHVVDFIDLYAGSWHWPAFNVADMAITIGAGLVILDSIGLLGRKND